MPLTSKGENIMSHMKAKYGEEKGEQVFYASKNAGTISGVDEIMGGVEGLKTYGPETHNDMMAPEMINQGFGGMVMNHEAEKPAKENYPHGLNDGGSEIPMVHGEKPLTENYQDHPVHPTSFDAKDGVNSAIGLGPKQNPGTTFLHEFPHDPFKGGNPHGGFAWETCMTVEDMTKGPLNSIYKRTD